MVLQALAPTLLSLGLPSAFTAQTGVSLPQAAGRDPFAPGLRWAIASSQEDPWIPRSVTFVGDGEYLWAAPAVGTPHLSLFHTGRLEDPMAPLWRDDGPATALGEIQVRSGDTVEELFALAQYPDPDGAHRRSVVTRHDALEAARSGSFQPVWSFELGGRGASPAQLGVSADGEVVCTAVQDAARSAVRVEWLDPGDGTPLHATELPSSALSAFGLSADGAWAALALSDRLVLVPGDPLGTALTIDVAGVTTLALSADGSRIACGSLREVALFDRGPLTYVRRLTLDGVGDEVVTRLDLSADGSSLAVAWWNLRTAASVRCELRSADDGSVRALHVQSSPPGGQQNYPIAVDLSADGRRALFGTWGVGGPEPEVLLLESGVPDPIHVFDLPGSVMTLALDHGGTRMAVGHKELHANQFATGGTLSLFDTGERDLQVLGAQRPFGATNLRSGDDRLGNHPAGPGRRYRRPWRHADRRRRPSGGS